MFDSTTSVFWVPEASFPKEDKYRFENAYYIRYNIRKAQFALENIITYSNEEEPDCFLCHIHIDLLFEACGMINKRFREASRASEKRRLLAQINRDEYGFDEAAYPLLSQCDFRNFIEHIEERGDYLIGENSFFGTFNVVYARMDGETRKGLTNPDRPQSNLLNLEEMSYTIMDKSSAGALMKTIMLRDLKQELDALRERADRIWDDLTNGGFFIPR